MANSDNNSSLTADTKHHVERSSEDIRRHRRAVLRFGAGVASLFFVCYLVASLILVLVLVAVSGGRATPILSGSMAPGIRFGDMLIYQPTDDVRDVSQGQVIVYDPGGGQVAHRVVSVDNEGTYVITKGDANASNDSVHVTNENIVGGGRWLVPFIGIPSALLQTGRTLAGLLIVVLFVVAGWFSRWGALVRYDPWVEEVAEEVEDPGDGAAVENGPGKPDLREMAN